jgi:ribosomal protein L11 methylase PrmA
MRKVDPGSFRDPSGSIFTQDGDLFRQVNACYREEYDLLMGSGLYTELTSAGLMVTHEESTDADSDVDAYKLLKPRRVTFISYPYEWCFSQLKDAALLTLDIQKRALAFGMSLKDASAFNVQFVDGRPVFIDTISFERYQEGKPWVAYRQFCMHFLAPLALMSYCDIRLGEWFRVSVDGVPLDLAATLLPFRTLLHPSLCMHIHMHARSQRRYAGKDIEKEKLHAGMSKFALLAMVDSLDGAVKRLEWTPSGTEWADYYQDTNYSMDGLKRKKELVTEYIKYSNAKSVWDLGANDGTFSRIASSMGIETISFDIDPACVENNYRAVKSGREGQLLPLCQDLTNPSPGIGWASNERSSLAARGPCDLAMALALVHHLAISNNVPLQLIASYFASLCSWLIIEFVPKEDSQVQRLLATRTDIFDRYEVDCFEREFKSHFEIVRKSTIKDSCRLLYLMRKVEPAAKGLQRDE